MATTTNNYYQQKVLFSWLSANMIIWVKYILLFKCCVWNIISCDNTVMCHAPEPTALALGSQPGQWCGNTKEAKQRVLMHGHQGWNVRHGLCHIYMRYVYIYELFISFVSFVVLFITVTWWYVWCFEWASDNQEEVQACLVTLWLFIISCYSLYKTTLGLLCSWFENNPHFHKYSMDFHV